MKKQRIFTFILISLLCFTIFPFPFPLVEATEISRVQGPSRGTGTSSSTTLIVNVTLSSAPTSGNLLIATISVCNALGNLMIVDSINQTNVTWTKQESEVYAFFSLDSEIWGGVVGSGASEDIAVAISGDNDGDTFDAVADVIEYSGLKSSSYLDQTASTTGGSQWTATGTTETTTQANELWIGCIASKATTNQSSPTNGFTLFDGIKHGTVSNGILEKIVDSAGEASSGTETVGSSGTYAGCIATFFKDTPFLPTSSDISTSTVTNGSSCVFSCYWESGNTTTLSGYIFGSNVSGSWVNQTWTAFSETPSEAWANATDTLPTSLASVVQYGWWANDTDNNWGSTEIQNLTTLGYFQVGDSDIISMVAAGTNSSQSIRHQEKSFYAAGRFWIFYMDDGGVSYYAYYTSSSDGINWLDPVCLNESQIEWTGENVQVLLSASGIIHVFVRDLLLYYGSATPNSDGSLTWLNEIAEAINPVSSNTDFCACLDSDGYPWVIWAYGSSLSNQTVYAYKSEYNNGSWSLASGFPINIVGPAYWSNNMIIPLSSGDVYFLYYRAAFPIYGKLWNGTLGAQETCSSTPIINEYPSASESWNRAWTVDDADNLFLSFLNSDNELVITLRNSTTGMWSSEALVQSGVVDSASPSLNWINGFLNLFWIHNATCIANEAIQNAIPVDGTLSYSVITGSMPLGYDAGYSGRLNAFTANFNGKPALIYVTNATLPNYAYTYQINLGLFDFTTYTITTIAGTGGSISPSSAVVVQGSNQDFVVTPNALYNLETVKIDNGANLANNTDGMKISFVNVVANHTLSATFFYALAEHGEGVSSPSIFAISNIDLGRIQPNSTIRGNISVAFSSSSFTLTTLKFSTPFNDWLLKTQESTQLTGGNATIEVVFNVPNVRGRFSGTITAEGIDNFGFHTAHGKISAQVGEDTDYSGLLGWIRRNAQLTVLLAMGVLLSLVFVAGFSRRKHH